MAARRVRGGSRTRAARRRARRRSCAIQVARPSCASAARTPRRPPGRCRRHPGAGRCPRGRSGRPHRARPRGRAPCRARQAVAYPAVRSNRKTSIAASAVTTRSRPPGPCPRGPARRAGRATRMTALIARSRMPPAPPVSDRTGGGAGELEQGRVEGVGSEVRPQEVGEVELRVLGLPDQEVADAVLATGPDQQVERRQAHGVQTGVDRRLVDLVGRSPSVETAPGRRRRSRAGRSS